MTSKIVVNNIEADAGVSTVTFNSNIVRGGSNLHSTGLALGAGSTIGAVTGVTTYYGDGSQLTGIDSTKIETGNTKVETIDTGSDGHIKVTTEGTERLRIKNDGKVNITPGGTLSGSHPPGDLNIVGTNFLTMTPNDNANPSDNEVLGQVSFLPYGAGSIGAASAKIEAVAESGQSGSANPTSLRFYTKPSSAGPGNSGTERMRITQDGYVTKPQTPAFHVSRRGGNVSANNYVVFDQVFYNNGSHYNTSNGRFTAPVTGIYFFSAWHFIGGTSAFALRINGSQFGEYTWDDTGGCATWVAPMTAGQYAQIYTVSYTFRGTSDYHNGFNGFLIG